MGATISSRLRPFRPRGSFSRSRDVAPHLFEEIHGQHHMIGRQLRRRGLDVAVHDESFPVGRNVDIVSPAADYAEGPAKPLARLLGYKRITFDGITYHHD